MRIVYELSIRERLDNIILNTDKPISYIELTTKEWIELSASCYTLSGNIVDGIGTYRGIEIRRVSNED